MKVQVDDMWVTPRTLVMKVAVWAADGSWRQKRYASVDMSDIPEEVILALSAWYLEGQDQEQESLDLGL